MTSRDPIICHTCKGEGIVWKRVGFPPRDEYFKCGACDGHGEYQLEEDEIDPTYHQIEWPDEDNPSPSEPDPTA